MGRPREIIGALREELWRRYKAGETVLGLGVRLTSVRRAFTACCRRLAALPYHRSRSSRVLRFSEREEISRGVAAGYTFRAIARACTEPFPR